MTRLPGALVAVSPVGGKNLGKGMSKWSDVKNAFDHWAKLMRYRLCVQSAREGCRKP